MPTPFRIPSAPTEYSGERFNQILNIIWLWLNKVAQLTNEEVAETAVTSVTASYVVGLTDGLILADTTAGNMTITLPDATTVLGREFTVKKLVDANAVTVATTAGNIDDDATFDVIVRYESNTFKSDGTDYWITATHYGQ